MEPLTYQSYDPGTIKYRDAVAFNNGKTSFISNLCQKAKSPPKLFGSRFVQITRLLEESNDSTLTTLRSLIDHHRFIHGKIIPVLLFNFIGYQDQSNWPQELLVLLTEKSIRDFISMRFPRIGKSAKRYLACEYAAQIIGTSPRSQKEDLLVNQEDLIKLNREIYSYIRDGFTEEYFRPTHDNQYMIKILKKIQDQGSMIPGFMVYDLLVPLDAKYEIRYDHLYGQYPVLIDELS